MSDLRLALDRGSDLASKRFVADRTAAVELVIAQRVHASEQQHLKVFTSIGEEIHTLRQRVEMLEHLLTAHLRRSRWQRFRDLFHSAG